MQRQAARVLTDPRRAALDSVVVSSTTAESASGMRRHLMTTMSMLSARALSTGGGSQPFVVAVDGVAERTAMTSKEFLTSSDAGAYTTARTCAGGSRLFEWDMHVARTAESVASMVAAEARAGGEAVVAAAGTAAALRPRVEASVGAAVGAFKRAAAEGDACEELKVTVLVGWEHGVTVSAHVAPLPAPPTRPVRVEFRGQGRSNAAAKSSSWVAERAPLEGLMREASVGDVNEFLLLEGGKKILEGSQTNFFAVKDGALVTAGEGVLFGTVRRLALEVCDREKIPVVLEAPDIDDVHSWEGAFVSSTSRLMLPIDELYAPQDGAPSGPADLLRTFDNGADSLPARLQRLVAAEVEAHSTAILTMMK